MYEILQQVLSYLRSMWRYRWYAMGMAWLIALGGWGYVYSLKDVYTASAQVNIDTESVLRPLMRGLTIEPDLRQRLSLMTRTLLSRPNLEKLARMSDMDINATTPAQMDAILGRLSGNIHLQGSGRDVNIYNIQYSSSDPQQAKSVVQNLVTILTESTLGESRENSETAQRFLQRQLDHYKARMTDAEKKLREFKQENRALMPTLLDGYFESLQTTKKQLAEAKLQLEEATRRRNELRRQLGGEEPTFGLGPDATSDAGSDSSPLAQRIHRLEEQRDELLLQYTDKHPKIISIDQTIKALREQQKAEAKANAEAAAAAGNKTTVKPLETNPVYQQIRISLAQAEAEASALKVRVHGYQQKVDELEKRVDQIPKIESKLNLLQQEYNLAKQKYNEFLDRQQTAELSEEVDKSGEGLRIDVINPPHVPSGPTGPNRLLFNSVVLVFALGAGIALAFVLSQLKPVVHDSRILQQITNLPVYGSVSRIWTTDLLRKKRIEYGGFATVGVMLFGAYASLLVYIR
jgi:polysaccharide chain length determinant protein (PEP-CTERM system associated)